MLATLNCLDRAPQRLRDEYLGFTIEAVEGAVVALPRGSWGEPLMACNLPQLRGSIWRWWYQVA